MDGSMTTLVQISSLEERVYQNRKEETVVPSFNIEDTDLLWWLEKAEEFARCFLKEKINLSKQFVVPKRIPWRSAIPIFDPGIDNMGMVRVLQSLGVEIHQMRNVMSYSCSHDNGQPSLHLMNNSRLPDEHTLGKSPRWLRRWYAPYNSLLTLRGYGLAFALCYYGTKQILDARTFTWFPEDCLPGGLVARAEYFPSNKGKAIDIYPRDADVACPEGGVRLAVSVPLR